MSALSRRALLILWAGTILSSSFLLQPSLFDPAQARAASSTLQSMTKGMGNEKEGRKVYNGKGFCYQCHGIDGYIDRRPKMDKNMRRVIDQLKPPPADFRNAGTLKSKNDQERIDTIQNGHRSTAMFPHKYLNEEEINNILAYLSVLRSEGKSQAQGSETNRK